MLHEKTGRKIPPHNTHTTILTGDFNFVEHQVDRINMTTMTPSGNKDTHDTVSFRSHVTQPHNLLEVTQPHHTHKSTTSTAKLDRFYINHHPLDQLDHSFNCTALEWNTEISDHRPIRLTKTSNQKKNYSTIPLHHINHPDWATKLQQQYHVLLHNHATHDGLQRNRTPKHIHPMHRLRIYKDAMWLTSQQMQDDNTFQPNKGPSNPPTKDALLSHMLSTISHTIKHDTPKRPNWAYLDAQHPMSRT